MGKNKTSLSAGLILREILLADTEVSKITKKIFPVATDEAILPFVLYRRVGLATIPNAVGMADTIDMEVICYAANYAESVELAEAVRHALDLATHTSGELRLRSCVISDADEGYADDAFAERMIFKIKI